MQEKWVSLAKQRPKFGDVVEVAHAITGVGAPERPDYAYTGIARYREAIYKRGTKPGKMANWVFQMVKCEPGYDILDNGGLEPTHWRRIKQTK